MQNAEQCQHLFWLLGWRFRCIHRSSYLPSINPTLTLTTEVRIHLNFKHLLHEDVTYGMGNWFQPNVIFQCCEQHKQNLEVEAGHLDDFNQNYLHGYVTQGEGVQTKCYFNWLIDWTFNLKWSKLIYFTCENVTAK